MEEVEVKFLSVNKAELEAKLIALGAEKKGEWLYHRQVFDYPGFPLDKQAAWVRLRDEGNRIMLGYKQRLGWKEGDTSGADTGMYEVEVEVNDFGKTAEFLYKIGLINKFFLENKRTRYVKDEIEFDIDE